MNTLDSRSLRYTDCYLQKFSSPGQIRYHITTTAGACLPVNGEVFIIEVNRCVFGKQKGQQHNVTVRREGQKFVADPPHLEIEAGDFVLWRASDSSTPGFTVRGSNECDTFNSSALMKEAVFTHAFGMPGEYEWVDANNGEVSGVIEVYSLDSKNRGECENWLETLEKGTLITICEKTVTPKRIRILTGQTIFWAIERASGISITDARLVQIPTQ